MPLLFHDCALMEPFTTLYVTFKEYGRKRSFESGTNWSDLLKQARDYAKNLEQRPMEIMSHDPNVVPLNYIPNSWREKKGKTIPVCCVSLKPQSLESSLSLHFRARWRQSASSEKTVFSLTPHFWSVFWPINGGMGKNEIYIPNGMYSYQLAAFLVCFLRMHISEFVSIVAFSFHSQSCCLVYHLTGHGIITG